LFAEVSRRYILGGPRSRIKLCASNRIAEI
jgi:hypothetical protein